MRKRRVRLDDDLAAVQPRSDIRMIQPRVQFVLSDGDLAPAAGLDVLFQLFQVVDAVVGYTDGFDLACFLGFD